MKVFVWLLFKKSATPAANSKSKVRIIVRNVNDDYSCLYSIVVDVISNEKLEMQPEKSPKIDKSFVRECDGKI